MLKRGCLEGVSIIDSWFGSWLVLASLLPDPFWKTKKNATSRTIVFQQVADVVMLRVNCE